ncbi:DUF1642 domain-containing protein [Lacticaseibacillus paracasei]|uniref:hypothetical protein n=1 Tax=Lacticaseibacillus paracasei TaxID=1597 RepID=UPI00237F5203|nr:hypothetical protein [Lacticaseibacillus paracasei]MDE3303941.1 DUF1642 domain-containing protein [Lacticaseibacillus paracasei]
MSNETKRDVFEKLAECYAEVSDAYTNETGSPYYRDDEPNYLDEYAAALPDDLPVIPEAVSEWVRLCKGKAGINAGINNILDALTLADLEAGDWIEDNSEAFARAWVLGVWRVEETGEVVKL